MENFILYNPTKIHFGRNVIENLNKSINRYGQKVLLIYGRGSIKKNGIYDQVILQLKKSGAEVTEYAGIRPNPIIEDVDAAATLGREKQVDMILAVGGGSVIDSAKIISITIPVRHSGWEFIKGRKKPQKAIPLIAVLTLAATGTEMNRFAVIQNNETKEKLGYGDMLTYPKESFLDPSYTISVSRDYTAFGIVDLIAHSLEAFFGDGKASLSDRFVYSIILEAMENGVPLLKDLSNYSLREKIMYAATNALNNLTVYGRKSGDWGVHSIGHVLSLLYDVPHGASLSIAYLAWLKLQKDRIPDRITELGLNLFGTSKPGDAIEELESFFSSLESPIRLKDININVSEKREEIYEGMIIGEAGGSHHKLSTKDYHKLIDLMA